MFPIRRVDRARAEAVEPLGSKPKFWYREGTARWLFKAEDRGTGEDWAEVIACHLCNLLGLPHVDYELAAEYDGDRFLRPGVVCANMASRPVSLVLGNQLLLARDPDYPTEQRFKVRHHTIESVAAVLDGLAPPPTQWAPNIPGGIGTALDVFVGYVMLDAWIANQDRHHENWGALAGEFICLAPTFDHGAALARNLTDRERTERLTTKDRNRAVAAFAERGRSAFYGAVRGIRPVSTLDAFVAFAAYAPVAKQAWLERLRSVDPNAVSGIIESVPPERMSETSRRFALTLLLTNQHRLLEKGRP